MGRLCFGSTDSGLLLRKITHASVQKPGSVIRSKPLQALSPETGSRHFREHVWKTSAFTPSPPPHGRPAQTRKQCWKRCRKAHDGDELRWER